MPEARATTRALSWILLLIAAVYFAFRGPVFPSGQRLWDYAVCASSSYLWAHGQDPFHWDAVKASWMSRGGAPGITRDIGWLYAIVPPTTLVVLAPFAVLPVAAGAYLYLLVTTILTGLSTWMCGTWAGLRGGTAWRFYIAAVLVSVPATLGLYSGNPTMLAVPLLLIGSCLISSATRSGREVAGGLLVGIGVACKVQIGLPILAFWVVWTKWRASLVAVLAAGAIFAIGAGRLAYAEVDWLSSWIENVRAMTTQGGLNDYATAKNPDDLVNLQVALFRITGDRPLTDLITGGLWLLLAGMLAAAVVRSRWERGRELPLIGCVGLLLLLPVYHRTYDALVLLPFLAMVMAGLAENARWKLGWLSLTLLGALAVPAGLPNYLVRRGLLPMLEEPSVWASAVLGHKGWCLLALSMVWCVVLAAGWTGRAERDVQEKS